MTPRSQTLQHHGHRLRRLNTTQTWEYFATTIRDAGVKPVQALWNISSVRHTQAFPFEMGLFEEPLYFAVAPKSC